VRLIGELAMAMRSPCNALRYRTGRSKINTDDIVEIAGDRTTKS
jgi:hypothetical protein